jgi:hypothetical protein
MEYVGRNEIEEEKVWYVRALALAILHYIALSVQAVTPLVDLLQTRTHYIVHRS